MKKTCHLLNLTRVEIEQWLQSFDAVLTDCDGVLWHENVSIPNVPDVINKLQEVHGKRVYFVTNNGTKTRHEIWQRASKQGYRINEDQFIAPTYTIGQYLRQHHAEVFKSKKAYVIGNSSVGRELDDFGIPHFGIGPDVVQSMRDIESAVEQMLPREHVGAVIVAFDDHFSFGKILKATNYLTTSNGKETDCLFIATNMDPVVKYPMYHIPGTGSIVKAIETSAGRQAMELGKPNPIICENLINDGLIKPARTLMIGDSCIADVKFGKNCGFYTLLVGSGQDSWTATLEPMFGDPIKCENYMPDFYLPDLGKLLEYL